ncbi:MAG: Aldose 1-epimerase [Subtercola sp.]|nr:Aldose 1-epimerase [Subtercola sp.]
MTITSTDGSTAATFIPSANLVCSALKYREVDWFDPIRTQEAKASGKDYGISLVHPWAGRLERYGYKVAGQEVTLSVDDDQLPHDNKHGLPIHGVWDRLLSWNAEKRTEQQLDAHLTWAGEKLLSVFPFPHELFVTASIETGRLRVETELRPTGDVGVPVAFGYHAFLRIPDSARSNWTVRLDANERLLLDESGNPSGATTALDRRQFRLEQTNLNDDISGLDSPAQLAFGDGHAAVSMQLEEGFSVAHLFAPQDRDLVSFEPMTAPANALNSGDGLRVVSPGHSFRTVFAIQLRESP